VNRQPGSGTRVWLDAVLKRLRIDPVDVDGYTNEKMTHSEVALAVSQGQADAGLGVQSAAIAFGLDFVFLTTERYDLIVPAEEWEHPAIQSLVHWLGTREAKDEIDKLGGFVGGRPERSIGWNDGFRPALTRV
jgi:putative molybdopterin biosynthesis protein